VEGNESSVLQLKDGRISFDLFLRLCKGWLRARLSERVEGKRTMVGFVPI